MRCSPARPHLHPTSGCWRSSASSQALASAASGRWPAPTSPRPGRRTGGRWEPGTFTPATTSASSSRRACTIGAAFGWRAMFLCGLFPVVVSIATLLGVKEPERWEHKHQEVQVEPAKQNNPFAVIFSRRYLGRTVTMSALLTVAIVGLWAGAVYEPTAIVFLSRQAGMAPADAAQMVSFGTGL